MTVKYFIYEEDWGVHWYSDKAEFLKAVEDFDFLGKFCDDGWSEMVTQCFAGECPADIVLDPDDSESDQLEKYTTFVAEKFDVRQRPSDDELNEEGRDAEGTYWGENWAYICNYHFVPTLPKCPHCENEAEPGRIETDNNGPIVDCPMCNGTGYRKAAA